MPYEYLEEMAVADIAFHAWGRDVEEVFTSSVEATMNVMVEDLGSIRPVEMREVHLEQEGLDLLLFEFLQEFIYYKDSEKLMMLVDKISVIKNYDRFALKAVLKGERIDPQRHHTRADVKAVTLHRFHLVETDKGWDAMVILDI
ncbi:MAG TPA: archease [Syntrophales bacterium]|nr:archease [Syntrophales bacterium]